MKSIFRILNDFLWIILGVLIAIWLIYPDPVLDKVIWIGFAIGCIFMGINDLFIVFRDDKNNAIS